MFLSKFVLKQLAFYCWNIYHNFPLKKCYAIKRPPPFSTQFTHLCSIQHWNFNVMHEWTAKKILKVQKIQDIIQYPYGFYLVHFLYIYCLTSILHVKVMVFMPLVYNLLFTIYSFIFICTVRKLGTDSLVKRRNNNRFCILTEW